MPFDIDNDGNDIWIFSQSDNCDSRVVTTECGKLSDDYDVPGDYTINGHYHYANGACDDEPSYANGGPA